VPIVFVRVYDPVEIGLVTSVANPRGNVTGLIQISADLGGKRLELLKKLVPKLKRVAILWHPANLTNLVQKKGGGSANGRRGHQVGAGPGPALHLKMRVASML